MRNFINMVENFIEEECVDHDKVWKSTWTEWQDRDGIYLTLPGSNSVWVGFCNQKEAEDFAATLDGDWKVIRWGRYKDMSDEDAMVDPEVRYQRIKYGFWVEPIGDDGL